MAADERSRLLGDAFRITKHDSLLASASDRIAAADDLRDLADEGGVQRVVLRAAALTLGSEAIFVGLLFFIGHFYWRGPVSTTFFAVQLAVAGAVLAHLWRGQRWHRWLGIFYGSAAMAGIVVGFHIYFRHLVYYYHYRSAKVFSDVAASQPAALFADAGMLSFTLDTHLDTSASVGYRSPELDATLCVAPLVDSATAVGAPVSLFAVGVDCCMWRSVFRCDDAGDLGVTSGLLHPLPDQLVNPLLAWAIQDPLLDEGFHRAVKLHSAVYGTVTQDTIRFLRWTRDPRVARDEYFRAALSAGAWASTLVFVAALVSAVFVACGRRRLLAMVGEAKHEAAVELGLALRPKTVGLVGPEGEVR